MNKRVVALLLFSGVVALLPHASAQGPLNPPDGPPAPTMKTLDQISTQLDIAVNARERRIPITTLPFSITHSGSYYLAASLTFSAASGDAIAINSSNVTLDLMG